MSLGWGMERPRRPINVSISSASVSGFEFDGLSSSSSCSMVVMGEPERKSRGGPLLLVVVVVLVMGGWLWGLGSER